MLIEAIVKATPVVKLVLLILIGMSIYTWAAILQKYFNFRRMEKLEAKFLDLFWTRFNDAVRLSPKFFPSPSAKLCSAFPNLPRNERLKKFLDTERKTILDDLSRFQTFFASVGSSAPFIGLFGTVWGIMNSFMEIAKAGHPGLEVVAPGISEALVATAIGLFAAIPAVIAYNYFLARIRKYSERLEDIQDEIIHRI